MTKTELNEVMLSMPISWRGRWCSNEVCGCRGGANCSGGLMRKGVTKEEWQEWVNSNLDKATHTKVRSFK